MAKPAAFRKLSVADAILEKEEDDAGHVPNMHGDGAGAQPLLMCEMYWDDVRNGLFDQ